MAFVIEIRGARHGFSLGLVFVVLDRECLACDISLANRESKN